MIRFGIIGTNFITEEFLKAVRELDGEVTVTGLYSRTEDRAAEFGSKYDIPYRYTDLRQFAESDQFDAVYIASPTSLHASQSIVCMDGGKHVLCEKPFASHAEEVEAMLAAAQRNGVVLMEAMKTTLIPNFQAIRDNLHKLGPVRRYFASFCKYSSRYDAYKQGVVLNAFDPQFSNGALMDLGVYCIYPAINLFGKPQRIQAEAFMLDSGVDGAGSMLLKYDGMEAVLMYSKITDSNLPVEIQGENATMLVQGVSQPKKVEIMYRNGTVEDVTVPQSPVTMQYEVREFVQLVREGRAESEVNTHARAQTVMELLDEAREQIGLVFPADATRQRRENGHA
ncbi:Gfo/Idh/MocA family protein [Paenibacillus koleovorans]|uniref:Gfo/Idh/MocA family protein n=1 Tax=Paenibacillus koleovorans TaxID=121608 RepID=UPI000FDBB33A|nr:Gfo/Idh/MocA family oxidoreductase [Paenibacillus koleovorans]